MRITLVRISLHLFPALFLFLNAPLAEEPAKVARPKILIVSIDGLRPDVALRNEGTTLRSLMREGSFTFYQAVTAIAETLPSHSTMLTGINPNKLQVPDERYAKEIKTRIKPPTLLMLAKKHGFTTGLAVSKSKLIFLVQPGAIDWQSIPDGKTISDDALAANALAIIRDHKPDVMFAHFSGTDMAGHTYGWGSTQQIAATTKIDSLLGTLVSAFEETAGDAPHLVIISADHGGFQLNHGANDPLSHFVPLIFKGTNVRENYDLSLDHREIDIKDVFGTAVTFLGIKHPDGTRGKYIDEAFEKSVGGK